MIRKLWYQYVGPKKMQPYSITGTALQIDDNSFIIIIKGHWRDPTTVMWSNLRQSPPNFQINIFIVPI